MHPLRALGALLVAAVAVVMFVTLGVVLLAVAGVALLGLAVVGTVRFWLLRRRLEKQGILLFPRGSRRDVGRSRRHDPDVIDVVPERD